MFNRLIDKTLQNALFHAVLMLTNRIKQTDDEYSINSFGVGAMMPPDMPETNKLMQHEVLGV